MLLKCSPIHKAPRHGQDRAIIFIIASAIIFFRVISRGVVLARGAYVTLRRLPCRAFVPNGFRTAVVRTETETLGLLRGHGNVAAPFIIASAIIFFRVI